MNRTCAQPTVREHGRKRSSETKENDNVRSCIEVEFCNDKKIILNMNRTCMEPTVREPGHKKNSETKENNIVRSTFSHSLKQNSARIKKTLLNMNRTCMQPIVREHGHKRSFETKENEIVRSYIEVEFYKDKKNSIKYEQDLRAANRA